MNSCRFWLQVFSITVYCKNEIKLNQMSCKPFLLRKSRAATAAGERKIPAFSVALKFSISMHGELSCIYHHGCFPARCKDGVMMWSSSAGLESHDWQPRSAQIEMTSYVLMAFFRRGSLVEGIGLMKWLSEQRNHLGGYGTTQVTHVATSISVFAVSFF